MPACHWISQGGHCYGLWAAYHLPLSEPCKYCLSFPSNMGVVTRWGSANVVLRRKFQSFVNPITACKPPLIVNTDQSETSRSGPRPVAPSLRRHDTGHSQHSQHGGLWRFHSIVFLR